MGGLAAIVSRDGAPVTREDVERMAAAASFRGPDGVSIAVRPGLGVAHLAHHTTPESHREGQPLWSRDGQVCLTADARIDNRPELIAELRLGAEHPQPTDADLILAAYLEWGEACLGKLVGDYAVLIHDGRTHTTLIARDAVGTRPLHYHWSENRLVVASDAAQILTVPGVPGDLDGYRIVEFLTCDFRPRHRTMFAAIQSVLPGHAIAIPREGNPRAWRHWRPHLLPPIDYPLTQDYVRHFRELLERSVADRMRISRGRAAVMLSGGVDSSAVAGLAADFASENSAVAPVCVSHVGPYPEMKEITFARDVADLHRLELRELEMGNAYPWIQVVREGLTLEGPWLAFGPVEESFMAAVRGCEGSVLLNGFGGDSLFDGARVAWSDNLRSGNWAKVVPWVRESVRAGRRPLGSVFHYGIRPSLPTPLIRLVDRIRGRHTGPSVPVWTTASLRVRLATLRQTESDVLPRRFPQTSRQRQWEGILQLAQQSVAIARWNFVAPQHLLELRMPLLDRRLAEFVLASPIELGAVPGNAGTKWLLRESANGTLPESVRRRKGKSGGDSFLNAGFRNWVRNGVPDRFGTALEELTFLTSKRFRIELERVSEPKSTRPPASWFYPVILMECWLQRHAGTRRVKYRRTERWSLEQESGGMI